jgi:6-phosphogluconolactonase/glucosamine-6-phosphate isomerase/deaminase
LNYYKISSSDIVAEVIANTISKRLDAGMEVLWLLSGGSAITPAVGASELLCARDLSGLTISLVDERYGQVGHPKSNWQSLADAGFKLGNSKTYPVLSGTSANEATESYNLFLKKNLTGSAYRLCLLGIGPDGHTAGILPYSPAVNSKVEAVYYKADDYQRITISAKSLALFDEAIIYCVGANKADALERLDQDLEAAQQPAQIIKRIPLVSVYNDRKGEAV